MARKKIILFTMRALRIRFSAAVHMLHEDGDIPEIRSPKLQRICASTGSPDNFPPREACMFNPSGESPESLRQSFRSRAAQEHSRVDYLRSAEITSDPQGTERDS